MKLSAKLPKKFIFTDINGNAVLEIADIFKLPIKEDIILQKSMEMFNDPDPCIIHKSAVIKQIILETCANGGIDKLAAQIKMPEGAVNLTAN